MYRAPLVVRNLVKAVPRRAGHGHAAPSSENALPKWVQALEQAPRAQAIAGSIGAVIVTSGLIASIMMARGEKRFLLLLKNASKKKTKNYLLTVFSIVLISPFLSGTHVHTLSDDWKNANKEFMKFQKVHRLYSHCSVLVCLYHDRHLIDFFILVFSYLVCCIFFHR